MKTLFWTILTFIFSPLLMPAAKMRKPIKNKVLIIQLGKLGDLLCTTPMFRAIKEKYASAEVHVLCLERSSEVLDKNPHADKLHFIDAQPRLKLFRNLKKERFDWVFNVLPGSIGSMAGLWALAPNRVNTPSKAHGVIIRWLSVFSQYNIPYKIGTSTFRHYMDLLVPMNVPSAGYGLDFVVADEVRQSMDLWMNEKGLRENEFVIFGLTAGNKVKEWPKENFARLSDFVTQKLQKKIVLSTLDQKAVEAVKSLVNDSDSVIDGSGMSLAALGALCMRASAFVSVDTGPMYAAYSVGCPVVIIIGPIHTGEQVPPESGRVAHVMPPDECEPWVFVSLTPRGGTEEQLECARGIKVADVAGALEKVSR